MLKKYRFGLDAGGLLLFFLIMLPNFIWFAVPAPNDILRMESRTPALDGAASVFQVLTVVCLCAIKNREGTAGRAGPLTAAAAGCCLLYYVSWGFYYTGSISAPVILGLSVFPCLALVLYAAGRKNIPAAVWGTLFAACHLGFAVMNFLI